MSVQGYYLQQPARYIGETWNAQACFTSQEDYFDCLDRENSINVNRKLCGKEHQLWKNNCPDADRKGQMLYRRIQKQNEQLYTAEELKNINHQANNRWFI